MQMQCMHAHARSSLKPYPLTSGPNSSIGSGSGCPGLRICDDAWDPSSGERGGGHERGCAGTVASRPLLVRSDRSPPDAPPCLATAPRDRFNVWLVVASRTVGSLPRRLVRLRPPAGPGDSAAISMACVFGVRVTIGWLGGLICPSIRPSSRGRRHRVESSSSRPAGSVASS
jgi:hypothetical protein